MLMHLIKHLIRKIVFIVRVLYTFDISDHNFGVNVFMAYIDWGLVSRAARHFCGGMW